MKNAIKLLAAFAILVTSIQVNAAGLNNPPKTSAESLVLKTDGEVVYLNLLNLDQSPVNVVVRDAMGRIVFTETIEETKTVHKAFNFTKAFKGTYYVKVKDGDKSYTKEVVIG